MELKLPPPGPASIEEPPMSLCSLLRRFKSSWKNSSLPTTASLIRLEMRTNFKRGSKNFTKTSASARWTRKSSSKRARNTPSCSSSVSTRVHQSGAPSQSTRASSAGVCKSRAARLRTRKATPPWSQSFLRDAKDAQVMLQKIVKANSRRSFRVSTTTCSRGTTPASAACSCRGRESLQRKCSASRHCLQASWLSDDVGVSVPGAVDKLCILGSLGVSSDFWPHCKDKKCTRTGTTPAFSSMFNTAGSCASHLKILQICTVSSGGRNSREAMRPSRTGPFAM
mmetsp:Transcript_63486/g.110680  ORF Transcript_63486/g.110680 Transcript_63486/m.110680 type:complete len:282 (+) Transcript_63486:396-1241(+)